jgi:hypothetical protein
MGISSLAVGAVNLNDLLDIYIEMWNLQFGSQML